VPFAADVDTGDDVLREDTIMPEFSLPADLDGDGMISSKPLDGTYQALPVVVRVAWSRRVGDPCELRFFTWLRGER
jgi:hypothetical protein